MAKANPDSVHNLVLALTLSTMTLIAVILTVAIDPDSRTYAPVLFGMVAAWAMMELVVMVLAHISTPWDGLSISMAITRVAIVIRFASITVQFSDSIYVAEWWHRGTLVGIGVSTAMTSFFLYREARHMIGDLTTAGRITLVASFAILVLAMAGILFFM